MEIVNKRESKINKILKELQKAKVQRRWRHLFIKDLSSSQRISLSCCLAAVCVSLAPTGRKKNYLMAKNLSHFQKYSHQCIIKQFE